MPDCSASTYAGSYVAVELDIRLDLVGQISEPGCENSVLMHICFLNNMYFFLVLW